MNIQLLSIPSKDLIYKAIPTKDHVKFWGVFRSYVVGGDNPGAELITTTLEPLVKLIVAVAVLLIVVKVLLMSANHGGNGIKAVVIANMPQLLWVTVVFVLLANQFAYAYNVSEGFWAIRKDVRNRSEIATVLNVKLSTAISNEIFNVKYGAIAQKELAECQGMPRPAVALNGTTRPSVEAFDSDNPPSKGQIQIYDYIDCLDKFSATLDGLQKDLQKQCQDDYYECLDAPAKALKAKQETDKSIKEMRVHYRIDASDAMTGNVYSEQPLITLGAWSWDITDNTFLKAVEAGNWGFMSYIELAYALAGALLPGVIAVSLLPTMSKVLADWFVSALSLLAAENVYFWLLGVVAVIAKDPAFENFSSEVFLFFLGTAAPWAALSVGLFSGFMLARSYRSAGIGGMTLVASAGSGMVLSGLSYLNHRKYLKR